MQSAPSLPENSLLQWLIMMACISVVGLVTACALACWKRNGRMIRRTALPIAILIVGLAAGHQVRFVHTPAMVLVVGLAAWNTRHSTGAERWASLAGALGMLGSIIAAALLF